MQITCASNTRLRGCALGIARTLCCVTAIIYGAACRGVRSNGVTAECQCVALNDVCGVARKHAAELGYDLDEMDVLYDNANSDWASWMRLNDYKCLDQYPEISRALLSSKVTVVYFRPHDELQVGGDLWVFVSDSDRRILGVIRGR